MSINILILILLMIIAALQIKSLNPRMPLPLRPDFSPAHRHQLMRLYTEFMNYFSMCGCGGGAV